MAWGWWRYRFGLSINSLLRIAGAVLAMWVAVKALPTGATTLGITTAVLAGAAVYSALLAVLFPQGWAKVNEIAQGLTERKQV